MCVFDWKEGGLGHLAADGIHKALGVLAPPWIHFEMVGRGGGEEVERLALGVAAFEHRPTVEAGVVAPAGGVEKQNRVAGLWQGLGELLAVAPMPRFALPDFVAEGFR